MAKSKKLKRRKVAYSGIPQTDTRSGGSSYPNWPFPTSGALSLASKKMLGVSISGSKSNKSH